MFDSYHNTKQQAALAPQTVNSDTTTNGATIDRSGYGAVLFALLVGNYTDGSYQLNVEHADDDGNGSPDTWADVPDGELLPREETSDAAEDGTALSAAGISKIGYTGTKKFVRANVVSTSTSTGATVAVACMLSHGRHLPFETQAIT